MNIPSEADFAQWNAGRIGDAELTRIAEFLGEMLAGADALGLRYSLASLALRTEYRAARAMLDRRRLTKDYDAAQAILHRY